MKGKRVKISVTAADIKKGVQSNCYLCPIARAAKRAMGVRVRADNSSINRWSRDGKLHLLAPLPAAARRFIQKFDEGKPVKPFSFSLSLQ